MPGPITTGLLALGGGFAAGRFLASQIAKAAIHIIMTDPYKQNLAEFYSAAKRTGIQEIIETNLRAEEGKMILRPLGSPRKFVNMNSIMFKTAHLSRQPTPIEIPIETRTIIGKFAAKPLIVETPLLVSGMAYGLALSEQFKYALALGSAKAGTATNTGNGPFLPRERHLAKKLIIQYPRASWNKSPDILKQADAIEIQYGQGASASTGHHAVPTDLGKDVRKRLDIHPGESGIIYSRMPAISHPKDLKIVVDYLRDLTGGVPIGVKFAFSDYIEDDIDICLEAGVDYLALEGAEAATIGAPPILEDDFGLPTLIGLCRAVDHLKRKDPTGRVSLIAGGGFSNPGHYLKAIALGADAVYLGTMALFAAAHTQVLKAVPFEPPTQVALYRGTAANRYNYKKGAESLYKYLKSCTAEMQEGVRALGKRAVSEVSREDLVALDEHTSRITGLPLAYGKGRTRALAAPGSK
ncbi:MAG: FMN-binding glutamate synthase family protein [Firmicutes bacterium]|nr:FMN-binding glutamate synthase family protein [Bacillota bacterium]